MESSSIPPTLAERTLRSATASQRPGERQRGRSSSERRRRDRRKDETPREEGAQRGPAGDPGRGSERASELELSPDAKAAAAEATDEGSRGRRRSAEPAGEQRSGSRLEVRGLRLDIRV